MNLDLVFSLCTYGVVPAWLLLTFAPKWHWTDKIVQQVWIPAFLACLFVFLFITKSPRPEGANMMSLNGLVLLYSRPDAALIGWLHYLTLDLFVGAWQVRDSIRLKIHPILVAPCLILTFIAGPMGLLFYFILRVSLRRKVSFS
jgi:hypothetical protein